MIRTLVRKELLTNLLTLRLGVAVIFTVVLSVLTTFIGTVDYARNIDVYEREIREYEEGLEEVTVYSQVTPRVVVPPQPLAILCRGVVSTAGQSIWINLDRVPVSAWELAESFDSNFMRILVQIDFATVVALLLSFLAVVLGFDGICGERERGTLKQLLVNPVPRGQVVLAKLLGGMISLWIPFSLAFVLSLLILVAHPDVHLAGGDWVRLGVFFVLSCLFLGQVFALSLMVSSLVRGTDTALIICLFAWLVGGVGYINVLPSVSRYGVKAPPADEFRDQNRQLWNEFEKTMEEWDERNPPPPPAYLKGLDRGRVLRYAHPVGYEWMQRRNAAAMDKRLELADRRYRYHWANWGPLARMSYIVDEWSIVSPFTNYQVLSYLLARTTLDDRFHLVEEGRDYRRTWIEYLRGKGAFASRRWFSDDPEGQEPMIADPASVTEAMLAADAPFMRQRMAWAEAREQGRSAAAVGLDLTDMPRFGGPWQRSLAASFGVMMPGLAVLVLSFALGVLLTISRFQRYDPR